MFRLYLARLLLRLPLAGAVLYLYLFQRGTLLTALDFRLLAPFGPLHIIWALLLGSMLWHLLPQSPLSQAGRKQFARNYQPQNQAIDRAALAAYRRRQNAGALRVMLLWLAANAVFFLLYWRGVIGAAELLLLSTAYFVGDLVCMIIFCPFQRWLMKNRCCIDCRIFDWGHFMMYTPFIPLLGSFFCASLFAVACLLLLHWELSLARHPERFWPGGNTNLNCANCRDRLCVIRRRKRKPKNSGQQTA